MDTLMQYSVHLMVFFALMTIYLGISLFRMHRNENLLVMFTAWLQERCGYLIDTNIKLQRWTGERPKTFFEWKETSAGKPYTTYHIRDMLDEMHTLKDSKRE